MAEENPFIGGDEVTTIVMAFRGRSARVVERQNFCGYKCGIQPEGHEVATKRSDHKPHSVERLAAMDGNRAEGPCAQQPNDKPRQDGQDTLHLEGSGTRLDFRNCAMSAFSFTRDGVWAYIMWPAS